MRSLAEACNGAHPDVVVVTANRTPSMRPCPKKCAALPLDAGKTIAMLVRAIWQIVGSRKELARLADLDDRMRADIGLT